MNTWLSEDEENVIPLSARHILDEMVRMNLVINFDNSEPNANNQWIMRVIAPVSMLGRVELLVTDSRQLYEQVADQILRYLRYLKTDVYPYYNPDRGGAK